VNPSVQEAILLGLLGFLPEEARADLLIHLIDMAGRWGFLGGITIGVFAAVTFFSATSVLSTVARYFSRSLGVPPAVLYRHLDDYEWWGVTLWKNTT